jgi:hypothetical protein
MRSNTRVPEQLAQSVAHQRRTALVAKAAREALQQPQPLIGFAQQQRSAIRAHRPALKIRAYFAPSELSGPSNTFEDLPAQGNGWSWNGLWRAKGEAKEHARSTSTTFVARQTFRVNFGY